MQEIRITVGDQGLQVEASMPPIMALGLLELAKTVLISNMGANKPQEVSPIVAPTGAVVAALGRR